MTNTDSEFQTAITTYLSNVQVSNKNYNKTDVIKKSSTTTNAIQSNIDHHHYAVADDRTDSNRNRQQQQRLKTVPLLLHLWDDTTHGKPREEILVKEGWYQYNKNYHPHQDDKFPLSKNAPIFQEEKDPAQADIIVWITTMGQHEKEIAPINYTNKVIVLDYADGCIVHRQHWALFTSRAEIGYFKRSFVARYRTGPLSGTYKANCTSPSYFEDTVLPYSYSGSQAMMIPFAAPEANHTTTTTNYTNDTTGGGYYQDARYENFLIPFEERRWTITNLLRAGTNDYNIKRIEIVDWTKQFVTAHDQLQDQNNTNRSNTHIFNPKFTAYVGQVQAGCEWHCFGRNYQRHLRDTQIVVTANPFFYEGDFRLWEAFLSGAMVFVDTMIIPGFLPNPMVDGVHFVQYDPSNRTDFVTKLQYYTNNIEVAKQIALRGYEFVLNFHMPTNTVEYVLDTVKHKLIELHDPNKRYTLGLPPLSLKEEPEKNNNNNIVADTVKEISSIITCYICGTGGIVMTKPDFVLSSIPPSLGYSGNATCDAVNSAGIAGKISQSDCEQMLSNDYTQIQCGCENVDR